MTKDLALRAAKNGAIAALISGGFTLALFVFATATDAEGNFGLWNDPLIVLDIVIIFVCAIGMFRRSRAAAISMTIYWILGKIYMFLETGAATGMLLSVVFLYYFAKAIQGTFAYHRIMKAEDPDYRAAPRWYYFVGIPIISLFFLLFLIGTLSMTDYIPSTEVVAGSNVSLEDRDALVTSGALYDDETIELFYSYGLLSVLEGGNILTDRAVVTYYVDENDQFIVYEYEFNQIESVQLYSEGDFLNDAIYKINSFGEDNWFTIELSVEAGGDVRFIELLNEKIRLAQDQVDTM